MTEGAVAAAAGLWAAVASRGEAAFRGEAASREDAVVDFRAVAVVEVEAAFAVAEGRLVEAANFDPVS